MGKKVNRGFFSYLLMFLGVVLAFFVICVVIMIFSPGTKIFGFSYFSEKSGEKEIVSATVYDGEQKVEGETFSLNNSDMQMNDISTIVLKSNIYSINVKQKEKTTDSVKSALTVLVNTTVSGFAKDNKIKTELYCNYFKNTKTLELVANAPTGFLHFNNTAYIDVLFPTEFNKNINIEIENENGNVYLGNNSTSNIQSNTLNVNKLDVNIKSGTLYSYNYFAIADSTKDSTLKTNNGKINFASSISANNLTVETENGNINLTSESLNVLNEFKVKSNTSFVEIKKATALNFDFDVEGGKIYAGELTGNIVFSQESNSCDFQANKIIGSLLIGTINTDFDKIKTKTSVLIKEEISGKVNITTNGEVNIAKITNSLLTSNIRTNSAKVNVSEVEVNLDVVSNSGQIILGKIENSNTYGIRKQINVTSNSGYVILYFDQVTANSKVNSKNNIYAYLKNGDCKITATASKIILNEEEKESPHSFGSNPLKTLSLESEKTIKINTNN